MHEGPKLVRKSEFKIDPALPFNGDRLGYQTVVARLTRLFERTPGPYVMAITADYGSGKTTFLKMWKAFVEKEGGRALYFDAWAHDFVEPPLTALIGEIEAQVAGLAPKGKAGANKKLHEAALKAIRALAPASIATLAPALLTFLTGALGGQSASEEVRKLLDGLGKDLGALAAEHVKDRIKDYELQKGTLDEFRKSLRQFALAVASHAEGAATNRFLPLVIFIDELDRCRPTYAIELLETVKHLFNVEGIVFVLGINRDALAQSLQAVYGHDFDGAAYLKRFIDMYFHLPKLPLGEFCKTLADELIPDMEFPLRPDSSYYSSLYSARASTNTYSYRELVAEVAREFGPKFGRSLRDFEQIFSRAGAALATLRAEERVEPTYFTFLMLFQDAAPDLFLNFSNGAAAKNVMQDLLSKFPSVRLDTARVLDAIIYEGLHAQHLNPQDIKARRASYRDASVSIQPPDFNTIAYMLLIHEHERLAEALKLAQFAQEFDVADKKA